jgi:glyoxylase-like metal-dependent hydrolase (beta-lactamase superfamily II)
MLYLIVAALLLLAIPRAQCELVPGSLNVHWDEGAQDCARNSQPPLQVHAYNAQTFIIRENLCATFEAPFMYLLIGSNKALLIDTGDVADPNKMPLAKTVADRLPGQAGAKLPLLVVHTHRHQDHRAGDPQFMALPNVQVVGFDLDSVRHFYNFTDWPNGVAEIDLGARMVDVMPTPGHNETEVSFYDRNTGLFFSGDFLMPARLLVEDSNAYLASAERVDALLKDRPLTYVLGGHIEFNAQNQTLPWQSQYHPNEHVLQLTKEDVLALPPALRQFNGFYTQTGTFLMINSIHILIGFAILVMLILAGIIVLLISYVRRRRVSPGQVAS